MADYISDASRIWVSENPPPSSQERILVGNLWLDTILTRLYICFARNGNNLTWKRINLLGG